jgi:hypothetical protein
LFLVAQQNEGDDHKFDFLPGVRLSGASYYSTITPILVAMQALVILTMGTLGDFGNGRKATLVISSVIGSVSGILLFAVYNDTYWLGGLLTVISNVALGLSIVMYNAYLPILVRNLPELRGKEDQEDYTQLELIHMNRVSSRGFILGYIAGVLLLAVNVGVALVSSRIVGGGSCNKWCQHCPSLDGNASLPGWTAYNYLIENATMLSEKKYCDGALLDCLAWPGVNPPCGQGVPNVDISEDLKCLNTQFFKHYTYGPDGARWSLNTTVANVTLEAAIANNRTDICTKPFVKRTIDLDVPFPANETQANETIGLWAENQNGGCPHFHCSRDLCARKYDPDRCDPNHWGTRINVTTGLALVVLFRLLHLLLAQAASGVAAAARHHARRRVGQAHVGNDEEDQAIAPHVPLLALVLVLVGRLRHNHGRLDDRRRAGAALLWRPRARRAAARGQFGSALWQHLLREAQQLDCGALAPQAHRGRRQAGDARQLLDLPHDEVCQHGVPLAAADLGAARRRPHHARRVLHRRRHLRLPDWRDPVQFAHADEPLYAGRLRVRVLWLLRAHRQGHGVARPARVHHRAGAAQQLTLRCRHYHVSFFLVSAIFLYFVDVKQGGIEALNFHVDAEVELADKAAKDPSMRVEEDDPSPEELEKRALETRIMIAKRFSDLNLDQPGVLTSAKTKIGSLKDDEAMNEQHLSLRNEPADLFTPREPAPPAEEAPAASDDEREPDEPPPRIKKKSKTDLTLDVDGTGTKKRKKKKREEDVADDDNNNADDDAARHSE